MIYLFTGKYKTHFFDCLYIDNLIYVYDDTTKRKHLVFEYCNGQIYDNLGYDISTCDDFYPPSYQEIIDIPYQPENALKYNTVFREVIISKIESYIFQGL